MAYVNCDLCGANDYLVLWNKSTHPRQGIGIYDEQGNPCHARLVVCRRCGLVYVNPRLSETELADFYLTRYRRIYPPKQDDSQEVHAGYIMQAVKELKLAPKRFLDIGCSRGVLVGLMAQQCEAYGVEPGGTEGSGNISTCAFEDYHTELRFDLITMLNTLEHVNHPVAFLRKARDLLTEDGRILVCVPDLHTRTVTLPVDAFLSDAHLYHFNTDTLEAAFLHAGLRKIAAWERTEEIGDKVYLLGAKGEPQYILPTLDGDYPAKLKARLHDMDIFYHLKKQGFR